MSHDKLSRKDLKHDELVDALQGAATYVEDHKSQMRRILLIGAGVLAAAGLAWGALSLRGRTLEKRFSEAVAVLDAPLATPGTPSAPGVKTYKDAAERQKAALGALKAIATDAPSSTEGRAARLVLVGLEGTAPSADALDALRKLADGGSLASGVAAASYLDALAASGKAKDAIAAARAWLDASDGPLPKDVAALTLAKLYEKAGQKAEAKTYYQRVVSEFPDSASKFEAQQKLTSL